MERLSGWPVNRRVYGRSALRTWHGGVEVMLSWQSDVVVDGVESSVVEANSERRRLARARWAERRATWAMAWFSWWDRWRRAVLVAPFAVLAGVVLRGLLPPFEMDDPFWRDFWSGPPAAGILAVVAALIAFNPARRSSRVAKDTADRQAWWSRTEWALERASSDKRADRLTAFRALRALSADATKVEFEMIIDVIEAIAPEVDAASAEADNEAKGRWSKWRRKLAKAFSRTA